MTRKRIRRTLLMAEESTPHSLPRIIRCPVICMTVRIHPRKSYDSTH